MHAIHDGTDFRLHDDHGISLSSVGQRLVFVFSWAHFGLTGSLAFHCQLDENHFLCFPEGFLHIDK